jgi:S1-C subfamily serine protease
MDTTDGPQAPWPGNQPTTGYPPFAPPPAREPRGRKAALVGGALAAAAIIGVGATFGVAHSTVVAGTAVAAQVNTDAAAAQPRTPDGSSGTSPFGGSTGQSGRGQSGSGQSGSGQLGGGQLGSGQLGGDPFGGGSSTSTLGSATDAQQIGIVDIDTVLAYEGAEAAGTGMVLTANGEILTNNHVVAGATSITVTIVSSGDRYQASVVGVDPTDDVAVLQLSGAADLATANLSSSANLAVGDAVTGVGNAGGTGGVPSASPGEVTALDQTITTQAEGSAAAETLHGLIETNADIQAGDSGGPLYDANDKIVGIDTAAEQGGYTTAGYAIPIASALSIAQQIENGQASENVVIGNPAFLGVQVSSTTGGRYRYSQAATSGALISGVVTGTPAAAAGLVAGDTITGVDGTSITTASDLTSALAGHTPGQQITVTWVDGSGSSQAATVTLATGPAL